jgi:spatacsin
LLVFRELSLIKVDGISSKIAKNVGSAVEATNKLPSMSRNVEFRYNRKNPKRRRFLEASPDSFTAGFLLDITCGPNATAISNPSDINAQQEKRKPTSKETKVPVDMDERLTSLSSIIAVLCEQQLFLPLLRAFEMFLPSCSLLPFIRSLQVSKTRSVRACLVDSQKLARQHLATPRFARYSLRSKIIVAILSRYRCIYN